MDGSGIDCFSLIILFWRDYRSLADYKYTFMLIGLGFFGPDRFGRNRSRGSEKLAES
jgi:hypothetical protein